MITLDYSLTLELSKALHGGSIHFMHKFSTSVHLHVYFVPLSLERETQLKPHGGFGWGLAVSKHGQCCSVFTQA
jgi:hypothetical protein